MGQFSGHEHAGRQEARLHAPRPQRIRSWSRWLRPAQENFHVLTPIALPLFGNEITARFTDRLTELQVRMAMKHLRIRDPLVFASIPSYASSALRIPHSRLIYYYSDKYTTHDDISAQSAIAQRDQALFTAADAVFCASEMITADLVELRDHVHYLPHAVDTSHFSRHRLADVSAPADLATIPHPRIGYYGSIAHNNDQDMIEYAARTAPDMHFVLIGKVFGDYSRLEKLANVHFLGFKPYADLPNYSRHFDVAFMNWKMTEWIRNCNPLKAKEYLAMGLPVVSIPIHELERHQSDLVYFASTPPEFLAQIQRALAEDSPALQDRRAERMRLESWDERTRQMLALLDEAAR
ncbi:MAG: glycosyltransferase [bacterium]|nr:glycosyltransferase [bacterium]